MFANSIGSKKHKLKELNTGKRKTPKKLKSEKQEHGTIMGAKERRAEGGYLSTANRKNLLIKNKDYNLQNFGYLKYM